MELNFEAFKQIVKEITDEATALGEPYIFSGEIDKYLKKRGINIYKYTGELGKKGRRILDKEITNYLIKCVNEILQRFEVEGILDEKKDLEREFLEMLRLFAKLQDINSAYNLMNDFYYHFNPYDYNYIVLLNELRWLNLDPKTEMVAVKIKDIINIDEDRESVKEQKIIQDKEIIQDQEIEEMSVHEYLERRYKEDSIEDLPQCEYEEEEHPLDPFIQAIDELFANKADVKPSLEIAKEYLKTKGLSLEIYTKKELIRFLNDLASMIVNRMLFENEELAHLYDSMWLEDISYECLKRLSLDSLYCQVTYLISLNMICGNGSYEASFEAYEFVKKRIKPNDLESLMLELLEDELSRRKKTSKGGKR